MFICGALDGGASLHCGTLPPAPNSTQLHPPQVFILDSVVNYTPADAKDAEAVVERVLPRLQVRCHNCRACRSAAGRDGAQ